MDLELAMYRLPQKECWRAAFVKLFQMRQSISNKKMLEDFNIKECLLHRVFVYHVHAPMNADLESNWTLG